MIDFALALYNRGRAAAHFFHAFANVGFEFLAFFYPNFWKECLKW